jgi:hypothetical protein
MVNTSFGEELTGPWASQDAVQNAAKNKTPHLSRVAVRRF